MGKILIGTSGFSYDDWRGPFYPEGLASAAMLPFYAQAFKTVEINFTLLPDARGQKHYRAGTENPCRFYLLFKGP